MLGLAVGIASCSLASQTTTTTNSAQLRKAAGSQSLSKLQEALAAGGWTAQDINIQEGKSALHMAAWKGCLENVAYLIDRVGCDVDAYSTGEFNYGKTAIFYAATQSREDVVDLLLERKAKVTIVNNKGQSVLSLCATHEMSSSVLEKIQALEQAQGDWWNFRESHCDGLEYGDLDPRFYRALKDTDVVTRFAVNPTTHKTRKGGFARRNPKQHEALVTRKQPPRKERNQTKRLQAAKLTPEQQQQLVDAWNQVEETKWENTNLKQRQQSIRMIIELHDKQFQPWLREAAERLKQLVLAGTCTQEDVIVTLECLGKDPADARFSKLVRKLSSRFRSDGNEYAPLESIPNPKKDHPLIIDWSVDPWRVALQQIEHLSISILERSDTSILRLPQCPSFVDTVEQLSELQEKLMSAPILALDTEWLDLDDNQVAVSTLQVALLEGSEKHVSVYVIDLQVPGEFRKAATALIEEIFDSNNSVLLGFAFGNDVPLLETFTGSSLQSQHSLDIQQLVAGNDRGNLPGLQKYTAQFSRLPLSKDQQCSQWGERPLSRSQLEYAGLDAAILLVLLAEHSQRKRNEMHPCVDTGG